MESSPELPSISENSTLLPQMAQIKIANMQKQIELAEQKARSATLQWTADKVKLKELKEQHKKEVDDLTTRLTILEKKARLQEQMQRDPTMLKGENIPGTTVINQNDDDGGNNNKAPHGNGNKQIAQFDTMQFENELTEKKLQIRNLSLQLSELRIEVANLNNKIDILTKRNEELVKNDDRLNTQVEQLTRDNQSLNYTVDEQKQAIQELEKKLAVEKENCSKLQKELMETESRQQTIISNLQSDLDSTKVQVKKLVFEKELLQTDVQSKQSEINRLVKENQKLMIEKQQEIRVQQHLLLALQQTAQEVKEYVDNFQKLESKSNKSTEEILGHMSTMNKKLIVLHTTIQTIMTEAKEKLQASEQLLKEKEEELATVTEKFQEKHAELEGQVNKLATSLAEEKALSESVRQQWIQEKTELESAKAASDAQIAELQEEIRKEQAIPGTKYTDEEIAALKEEIRESTTQQLQLEFDVIVEQRLTQQKEVLESKLAAEFEESMKKTLEVEIARAVEDTLQKKELEFKAKMEDQEAQLMREVNNLQNVLKQEEKKNEQLNHHFEEQLQVAIKQAIEKQKQVFEADIANMQGELEKANVAVETAKAQIVALEEEVALVNVEADNKSDDNKAVEGKIVEHVNKLPPSGIDNDRWSNRTLVNNTRLNVHGTQTGITNYSQNIGDTVEDGMPLPYVSSNTDSNGMITAEDGVKMFPAPMLKELQIDTIKQLILQSLITKNFYYNSDADSFLNSYPIDEDFLDELVQSFFSMNHKVYHIVQYSLDSLQQQFTTKTQHNFQEISSLVEEFLFTTAQEIIMKLEKSKEISLQQVKKDMREEMVEKVQEATKKQQEIKLQEIFELREQHESELKKKDSEFGKKINELENLVAELKDASINTNLDKNSSVIAIDKGAKTSFGTASSTAPKKLSNLRSNSMLFKPRTAVSNTATLRSSSMSTKTPLSGASHDVNDSMGELTPDDVAWESIHAQWRDELEGELRAQIYEEIMHKNNVHDNILASIGGVDFDNEELSGIPRKAKDNGVGNYTEEEFLRMREELLTGELSYIAEVRLENFDRLKNSRFGSDNIIALTILEHHIRYDTNPADTSENPSMTIQSLGGKSGGGGVNEEQRQRQYRMQLKSLEIQRTMLLQHILQESLILDMYAYLHTTNQALTLLTTMTAWQSLVHYSHGGNFRDVLEVHRQVLLTCIRAAGGTKAGVKALGFLPPNSQTDMWPEPFRIIALEVFRGELINEQKRAISPSNRMKISSREGKSTSPTSKKNRKNSPTKNASSTKESFQDIKDGSVSSKAQLNKSSSALVRSTGQQNSEEDHHDDEENEEDDITENTTMSSDQFNLASHSALSRGIKSSTFDVGSKKLPLSWSAKNPSSRNHRTNIPPTKHRNASAPDLLHVLAQEPVHFGTEQSLQMISNEPVKAKRFQGSLHAGVDYFVFRAWLGNKKSQDFLDTLHNGLRHWEENRNIQANTTFQHLLHSLTSSTVTGHKEVKVDHMDGNNKMADNKQHSSSEKENVDDLAVGIEILSQLIRLSLHSDITFEIQEIFQKVYGFLFCFHQGKIAIAQSIPKFLSTDSDSGGVSKSNEQKIERVIMHECAIQTEDIGNVANFSIINSLTRRRTLSISKVVPSSILTQETLEGTLAPGIICVKYQENMLEVAEGLHLTQSQTLLHDLDVKLNPGRQREELCEIMENLPSNIRYCHWAAVQSSRNSVTSSATAHGVAEECGVEDELQTHELPDGLHKASQLFNLPKFLHHFPVLFPSVFTLRQGVNLLSGGQYSGQTFPYYHFDVPISGRSSSVSSHHSRGTLAINSSQPKAVHQSYMPGVVLPPDVLFLQCPSEWGLYPKPEMLPTGVVPVKLSHQIAFHRQLLEETPLPPGHELVQILFPCVYDHPTGVEIARGVKFVKLSSNYSLPSNIRVIARQSKHIPLPKFILPLKVLSNTSSPTLDKPYNQNKTSNKIDGLSDSSEFGLQWETSLETGTITIMPKPNGIVFPLGMELIRRTNAALVPPGMTLVPPIEYPEGLESLPHDYELVQLTPRYDFPPACKISHAWYIFPRPVGIRLAPGQYLVYPDPALEEHMIPPLPSFACVAPTPALPPGLVLPARTVTVALLLSRFTQYCLPEGATLAPGITVLNPKNIYKGSLPKSSSGISLVKRPPVDVLIVRRTPGTMLPPLVVRGSRSDLPTGYLLGENMDIVRVAVRFEVPAGVLMAPGVTPGLNTQLCPGTLLQSSIIRASFHKPTGLYSEGVKVIEWPYGLVCAPGVELVTCPPEGCYLPFEYTPVQHSEHATNNHDNGGFPLPKLPPKSMLVKLPRNVKLIPAHILAKEISVGLESMFEEHYSRPLPPGCIFASKKHRMAVWPPEFVPLSKSALPSKLSSLLEDYAQGYAIGDKNKNKNKKQHKFPKAVDSGLDSTVLSTELKVDVDELNSLESSPNANNDAEEIKDKMNVDVIALPAYFTLPPGVELIAGVKVVATPFFWSLPNQSVLVKLTSAEQNLFDLAQRHIYPLDIPPVHFLPPVLRSFLSSSSKSMNGMENAVKQLNDVFSLPSNFTIVQLPDVFDVYSWGEVLPGVQAVTWELNNPKFPLPPGHFFIERPRQSYSTELPPGFALGIHPTFSSFRPPSSTSTLSAVFPPQIEIMHLVPRYYLPRNVHILNTNILTKQTFNTHTGGASTYSGPHGQEYVKNSFDPSWIVQLAAFEQLSATACVLPWPASTLFEPGVFGSLQSIDSKLLLEAYELAYIPAHPKENNGLHYPANMSKHPQSKQIVSLLFNSKLVKNSFKCQNIFLKFIGTFLECCLCKPKDSTNQFAALEKLNFNNILNNEETNDQSILPESTSFSESHKWYEDISECIHVVKMSNGYPTPEERLEYPLISSSKPTYGATENVTSPIPVAKKRKVDRMNDGKVEVVHPVLTKISTRKFHAPNLSAEFNAFIADFYVFHWYFSPEEKQYVERMLRFNMKDHAVEQSLSTIRKLDSQQIQLQQELLARENEFSKFRKRFDELNTSYAVLKEQCQKDEDYKGVIQKLKEQLAKQQQALEYLQSENERGNDNDASSLLSNQEILQLQDQLARSQQQQQLLISQVTQYEGQIKEVTSRHFKELMKAQIVTNLQQKLGTHLHSLKLLVMSLISDFTAQFHHLVYEEFHITEMSLFEILRETEKLPLLLSTTIPLGTNIENSSSTEPAGLQVDDEISIITEGDRGLMTDSATNTRPNSMDATSDRNVKHQLKSRLVQRPIIQGPYYSNYPTSTIFDPSLANDSNSVFSAITAQSASSQSIGSNYLPRDLTRDPNGKRLKVSEQFPVDVASMYNKSKHTISHGTGQFVNISKQAPLSSHSSVNSMMLSRSTTSLPTAGNQTVSPYPVLEIPRGVGDLLASRRKKLASNNNGKVTETDPYENNAQVSAASSPIAAKVNIPSIPPAVPISRKETESFASTNVKDILQELGVLGEILDEAMDVIVTHSAYTSGLQPLVLQAPATLNITDELNNESNGNAITTRSVTPGIILVSNGPNDSESVNISLIKSIDWSLLTSSFKQVLNKLLHYMTMSLSKYRQSHDHLLQRMEIENSQLYKHLHTLSQHDAFLYSLVLQNTSNNGIAPISSTASIRSANSAVSGTTISGIHQNGENIQETVAQLQERLFRAEQQYQEAIHSLLRPNVQPIQLHISEYNLLHEQLTSYHFHSILLKQSLQQEESALSLLTGSSGYNLLFTPSSSFSINAIDLDKKKQDKSKPAKSSLTENILSRSWEDGLLQKQEDSQLVKAITYRISRLQEKMFWLQEKQNFVERELAKTLGIVHDLMEKNLTEIQDIIPSKLMNALFQYKQKFFEKLKFQPGLDTIVPELKVSGVLVSSMSDASIVSSSNSSVGSSSALTPSFLPPKVKLGSIGTLPPAGTFSHLALKRTDTILPKKAFSKHS